MRSARTASSAIRSAFLLLLHVASPSQGAAQSAAEPAWRCDGRLISLVTVERQPPTIIGRTAPKWARPALAIALQHRTTLPSAVRPFLLLHEGGHCTEFERAESERLLRAQPYIADASVVVTPDGAGGARVAVTTIDEVPVLLGARARGDRITGLTYGSANALGSGMYIAAEWRDGFAYRDGIALRFVNYHAFDKPNRLIVAIDRSPLSTEVALALQRPLLTSHQRTAWHLGFSDGSTHASFARPTGAALALPLDHSRFDAGGIFRVRGDLLRGFAGAFVSHERFDPAPRAVIVTDTGFAPSADVELVNRFAPRRKTILAGVVGVRLLSFTKVQGFDALLGTQDIGRGIQLATIAGPSFSSSGNGTALGGDIYAAASTARSLVALRSRWEGEYRGDAAGWTDVVGSARLIWYQKLSPRRTLITNGEFAGAWRGGLPYQLPLGTQAGVRGYRDSPIVGARRGLMRAEHRWLLGGFTRHSAIGVAGFVDVGSVWAGAVPFGMDSRVSASTGAALLAAVPRQSRRTLRLDVAFPVTRNAPASYELRILTSAPLHALWREPGAIASVRTIAPAVGMFGLQ